MAFKNEIPSEPVYYQHDIYQSWRSQISKNWEYYIMLKANDCLIQKKNKISDITESNIVL